MLFLYFQKKHAFRKERIDKEETWQLSSFYPMVEVCVRISFMASLLLRHDQVPFQILFILLHGILFLKISRKHDNLHAWHIYNHMLQATSHAHTDVCIKCYTSVFCDRQENMKRKKIVWFFSRGTFLLICARTEIWKR